MPTHFTACPLCEAGCGLAIETVDGVPTQVRPDHDDPFSQGYVCPKGMALLSLDQDPDRLTGPVKKQPDGSFEPISWAEAYDEVGEKLTAVQKAHGRDAVALYMGTVAVHKYSTVLMRNALLKALGTRNSTSAGSQDTSTRFTASYFLYGSCLAVPVPDIDRTDFLLCLGGNPVVSNGSMMTAPNVKQRLKGIRERGGQIVVVDPRRSETARIADEHIFIRPGTDAALVLSMVHVLDAAGRIQRDQLDAISRGFDDVQSLLAPFTPEAVASFTGVPAETITRLAHAFADAPTAVIYGRMGPANARHGTLTSFAIDLLNIVTGRLGAVGGSMFPTPAVDASRLARQIGADGYDRFRSRVRGLPEILLDLPATTLAEEMETHGEGQVKAFVTCAGNPVLSVPNGRRLDRALEGLDFMVSIDIYINETTRHADIILPPCSSLAEDHLGLFFANMNVRNNARWATAMIEAEGPADWEIMLEIARRLGGGPTGMKPVDLLTRLLRLEITPATIADLSMRIGPYGDKFMPWSKGLSRKKLQRETHGVDLGPLKPGIKHRLYHRGGKVKLSHPQLTEAMHALARELGEVDHEGLLLIGRRELRSNNSWMHNLPSLVSGKARCLLYVHPDDAAARGLNDGDTACMESAVHRGELTVHVTDEVCPGVVSLPHGYGHGRARATLSVAGAHAGVSANDWTDDQTVETIVGQSILNGVPVELSAVEG
ncbi:MAG: molybdopterin-dependent oxidoreductase [Bradymonadia bacterium]